jgi:hypothetical protein
MSTSVPSTPSTSATDNEVNRGSLLKRKDFLGVDEEAGTHPNRTYYYRKSSDLQKVVETCTRMLQVFHYFILFP